MQFEETFPGRFESLGKISKLVKRAAEAAGLDDKAKYNVELAVDEACSNIVEHAYKAEDKGTIHCKCVVSDTGLTIIIRDQGDSFNPATVPKADTSSTLEDRIPGGVGLFFMQQVMDDVKFEFTPQGNVLTMVKNK